MLTIAAPAATAVVLIEFQNIWTRPGLYNSLVKGQIAQRGVVANAARLVKAARAAGVPVVHAPLVVDPKNKRGAFAHLTLGLVFRKGTRAAELDDRVYDPSYDKIAKGRIAFDAFVGSELEALLRCEAYDTLLFAGFATDQCVGKTMATARRKGFESWLVTDASATFADFLHSGVEKKFPGRIITTAEAVGAIETAASSRRACNAIQEFPKLPLV